MLRLLGDWLCPWTPLGTPVPQTPWPLSKNLCPPQLWQPGAATVNGTGTEAQYRNINSLD